MDIPATDNKKKDDKADSAVIDPGVVLGDPLATQPDDPADAATATDDATTDSVSDDQTNANDPTVLDDGSIVPNATVTTNDRSAVGEFKPAPPPEPPAEEFVAPESIIDPSLRPSENTYGQPESVAETSSAEPETQPEVAPDPDPPVVPVPDLAAPTIAPSVSIEPDDPEKIKFIKTYTAEFDEAMHRATDAVQKILDAIDTTINDHAPDIKIPEEANEFLDKAPTGGKVEKFEEAREIIRHLMEKANESKQQSEAAATEAAKVYDEVQQFKKDTKEQIAELEKK